MMLCTQVRHLAVQAHFRAWGANGNQHSGERMKLSGRSKAVLCAALHRCAVALAAAVLAGSASHADPSSQQPATVVFVCLHGSVKSVMAAAHFNRIAKERQLPFVAVARGVDPDREIPASIRQGGWRGTGLLPRMRSRTLSPRTRQVRPRRCLLSMRCRPIARVMQP
jgi:hypothetical protein